MNNDKTVTNIFISIMAVTIIAGYDIAHTETPAYAKENTPVASPEPFYGTSNIKVGEVRITPYETKNYITVKVSHYWPALGGVNCANFVNGSCISRMANGETWGSGIDKAIACPPELKFGTKLKIFDKIWTCKDRGGMIKKVGDVYWIDQLTEKAIVPYGEETTAEIL